MRSDDLLPEGVTARQIVLGTTVAFVATALFIFLIFMVANAPAAPIEDERVKSPVEVWLVPVDRLGVCAVFLGPDHRFAGRKLAVWCFPLRPPKMYPMPVQPKRSL